MLLGHWKNFEELEDALCIEELVAIREAAQKAEFQKQKFAAALKGVDLPDPRQEDIPTFEDIKRRAEAKVRGVSEEQYELSEVGIMIIEDDDEEVPVPFEMPDILIEEE